jgi:hypothetical protein
VQGGPAVHSQEKETGKGWWAGTKDWMESVACTLMEAPPPIGLGEEQLRLSEQQGGLLPKAGRFQAFYFCPF